MMFFRLAPLLLSLIILGCQHLDEKIIQIPLYSSKSDVLDRLGPPFQIKRKSGLDYWIYKIKNNKKNYIKTLIFAKNHLVKKGKKQTYPSPLLILEGVENLEDYKKAREIYKKAR